MKQCIEVINRRAYELARELSESTLHSIIEFLLDLGAKDWRSHRSEIINRGHNPGSRHVISEVLSEWESCAAEIAPECFAVAISTAMQCEKLHREKQTLDLIWTGTESTNLRRIDQALLELIQSASHTLLIVSFVAIKVKSIEKALLEACGRGVEIRIILEAPDSGAGKMALDTIHAFGAEVRKHAKIYVWPIAERPRDKSGNVGSLHAKCALADKKILIISSANITEYALNLNMELGVLVKGGILPETVSQHFDRLIQEGTFRQVR